MTLDLRLGAKVVITVPDAINYHAKGEIAGKRDGNYLVALDEKKETARRVFGLWWVKGALEGTLPSIPFVNISPKIKKLSSPYVYNKVEDTTQTPKKELSVQEEKKPTKEEAPVKVAIVQSHFLLESKDPVDNNIHKWGLQIGEGSDQVSEVMYILHPTFRNNEIKYTEAPFAIERTGWGTFTVQVKITLKSGKTLTSEHPLTFKGAGENVKMTQIAV